MIIFIKIFKFTSLSELLFQFWTINSIPFYFDNQGSSLLKREIIRKKGEKK